MSSGAPKSFFLLAICLRFLASSLCAQTFDQVGERAQGMGGAFVAVADDASAIYWNPGGLANVYQFDSQLDIGVREPFSGISDEKGSRTLFIGAAMPALGLAYYRTRTAVRPPGSRKNEGSGEVRVSTLATGNASVSLLQTIVDTLVIGTTLRVAHGGADTAFDLDLGAMGALGDLRMGMTARNLRHGLGSERQVRAGVAFAPRSLPTGAYGPFSIAFDADLSRTATPAGDTREAAVGSEQWWVKGVLGTRAGVHWSTLNEAEPVVSGGLTVRIWRRLFVEGHMTKGNASRDSSWGTAARLTF